MGISRWTVMAIQGNDVAVIDTPERSEAWMVKGGRPHALLLSCPLEKRAVMERVLADLKAEASAVLAERKDQ